MNGFLVELNNSASPNPDEKVFDSIWKEYERVIIHSLITTFELDFLVHDQQGGDVDTVHNVKENGIFKNPMYQEKYDNRGKYNSTEYHNEEIYKGIVREAREIFNKDYTPVDDTYVPGKKLYFSKGAGYWNRPALDHVISAHEVHDDPVRMLSDISGVELANTPDNLKFTNISLNAKMSDKAIESFLEWCDDNPEKVNWDGIPGNPLPDEVKERLIEEDKKARKAYYHTIEKDYYSSAQFYHDALTAAGKRGIEMGARQIMGYIFLEIWISCKNELSSLPAGISIKECIEAIKKGIERGTNNSFANHKELISQFGQGLTSGVISSFATTLINIFITTEINTVKYIRTGCVAIVQAGNVLLINPNDLLLGEQLRQSTIIIATGATNIVGSYIGDRIAKTPLGQMQYLGEYVVSFTSILVSGLLSCSFLLLLDRSKMINTIFNNLDRYITAERELQQISIRYYEVSAELNSYDVTSFVELCNCYNKLSKKIANSHSEEELKESLLNSYKEAKTELPWIGDFDDFMRDKTKPWNF